MYKFRKKILNEQLEKIKEELYEKKLELKEVTDILDDIDNYESLTNYDTWVLAFLYLFFALVLGYFSILGIVVHNSIISAIFAGVISVVFLGISCGAYMDIFEKRKKIKELKKKGVEKLKKKEEALLAKKEVLSKEYDSIENKKANIKEELENIAYYDRTSNDFLYQVDSEEEYELRKKDAQEYLKFLDDFLKEKVDYSKVQFNNSIEDEVKLVKKYNIHN